MFTPPVSFHSFWEWFHLDEGLRGGTAERSGIPLAEERRGDGRLPQDTGLHRKGAARRQRCLSRWKLGSSMEGNPQWMDPEV
ncbi:hypothetical protein SCOR_04560 [Sulfidibacter corallicola]